MSHTDIEHSILIKFVNHKFAKDLMNGKLYCNSISYFRNLVGDDGQGDALEGVAWYYPEYLDKTKCQRIEVDGNSSYLFCLFSLAPSYVRDDGTGYYKLSKEVKNKFINFAGNTGKEMDCIVIHCVDNFITRVRQAINSKYRHVIMLHAACEYVEDKAYPSYDENTLLKNDPSMSVFLKSNEYKWQEEYRFLFYNSEAYVNDDNALIIELGSDIKDIAHHIEFCFI